MVPEGPNNTVCHVLQPTQPQAGPCATVGPAPQAGHVLSAALNVVPAVEHVVHTVAPAAALARPAHTEHMEEPTAEAKVPCAHVTHALSPKTLA